MNRIGGFMKEILGLRKLLPYLLIIFGSVATILFLPDYPSSPGKQDQLSSVADPVDRPISPRGPGKSETISVTAERPAS